MRLKVFILFFICFVAISDSLSFSQTNSRAYIAINNEASNLINIGREAAKNGNWSVTVRNYQEALEKYPDNLIYDPEHDVYTGVKSLCYRLLSELPKEGQLAYQNTFDPSARTLMEMAQSAGDTELLREVIDRYLYTSYGIEALNLLAVTYLEKGEFNKSAELFEVLTKILSRKKNTRINISQILAYRAACYFQLKQVKRMEELFGLIKSEYQADKILYENESVSLVDFVSIKLTKLQKIELVATGDWGTYGGDNTHSKVMGPKISGLPLNGWSFQIPSRQDSSSATQTFYRQQIFSKNRYFPFFPSLHQGVLYLKTDTDLYAFNLISLNEDNKEDILWKFKTLVHNPIYEERVLSPVTIGEDKIFANLVTSTSGGLREKIYTNYFLDVKLPLPNRALFAFNASGGKILWTVGGQSDRKGFLEKASFPMPPVVEHNTLYALAVYNENDTDLPEQYLCSFNASTGELYWKTFITSGILEVNLFNNPSREIISSMLTVDADAIYYCSNIGAICAVDKRGGYIKWARKYEQHDIPVTLSQSPIRLSLQWVNNAPLYSAGTNNPFLIVTPVDSPYLYALDPVTGKELWRWAANDLGQVRYVLGVKDNLLYIQGEKAAICLDASKEGKRVWVYQGQLKGKGGLTKEAVYLSAANGIIMLDAVSGKIINKWDWKNPKTQPGNLLIFDNVLVSTSQNTLNVFYDWSRMQSYFKKQLEKKPEDAYLIQRIGVLALKGKKYKEAVSLFKEALGLVENNPKANQLFTVLKSYLYRTYHDMAVEISSDDPSAAIKHLESARQYAPSSYFVCEASVDIAGCYANSEQWEKAINQYQALIKDFPEESYRGQKIWGFSYQQINKIIDTAGSDVYEKQEQKAQVLYNNAEKTDDLEKLHEVFRLYPNSNSAKEALNQLIEIAYNNKNYKKIIDLANLFLRTFNDSYFLMNVYTRLIESYENLEMYVSAKGVLFRMKRSLSPDKMIVVADNQMSIGQYVKNKLDSKEYESISFLDASFERLKPPFDLAGSYFYSKGASINVADDYSDIFALSGQEIIALDATAKPVWSKQTGLDLLGITFKIDNQVIVLSRQGVLSYETGLNNSLSWFYTVSDKKESIVSGLLDETHLFIITKRTDQPLIKSCVCLDITNGKKLWAYGFSGQLVTKPIILSEIVVLPVAKVDTIILERATGQKSCTLKPPGVIQNCLYDNKGIIYLVITNGIYAYDSSTGKLLWNKITKKNIIPQSVKSNVSGIVYVAAKIQGKNTVFNLEMLEIDDITNISWQNSSEDYIQAVDIDSEKVYAISRKKEKINIYAYEVDSGNKAWQREIVFNVASPISQILFTPDYIFVNSSMFNAREKKWLPIIHVIDKMKGEEVQKIEGSLKSTGQPLIKIVGENICLIQDNTIHVYK